VVVSTGITVNLPPGTYGRIAPRSGLAVKHGLDTLAGVIDPDYTGEVKVVLQNLDVNQPFVIRPGYRIAQLILEQCVTPEVVEVPGECTSLVTERGAAGFGSTGI
jgi:dUTP pyrophosphatase